MDYVPKIAALLYLVYNLCETHLDHFTTFFRQLTGPALLSSNFTIRHVYRKKKARELAIACTSLFCQSYIFHVF